MSENKYDWRWENSISHTKQRIEDSDFPYVPWRTNSYFSNFIDTIFHANAMNMYSDLPVGMQYDYLLNAVRPKKRFFRRDKAVNSSDFNLIQDVYKYNVSKTRDALSVLSKQQIATLKKKIEKGGVS